MCVVNDFESGNDTFNTWIEITLFDKFLTLWETAVTLLQILPTNFLLRANKNNLVMPRIKTLLRVELPERKLTRNDAQ